MMMLAIVIGLGIGINEWVRVLSETAGDPLNDVAGNPLNDVAGNRLNDIQG